MNNDFLDELIDALQRIKKFNRILMDLAIIYRNPIFDTQSLNEHEKQQLDDVHILIENMMQKITEN